MAENENKTTETTQEEINDQATAEAAEQGGDKPGYEALEQALAEAEAKAAEHWEQILRLKAELDNARKRAEREVANAHKYALEKFIGELLPVKDSLELGHQAAGAEGADIDKVREGVELTLKMFMDTLKKFGVEEIDPLGQPFDPEQHQAMSMQKSEEAAPNTVINVFQKGFKLNDRLVRPAMVVVAGPDSGGGSEGGEGPKSSKIDEMA